MLDEMKSERIPEILDSRNLFTYNITFDESQGVNPELSEHKSQLTD